MTDFLLNSSFFGFALTLVIFALAVLLQRKTKIALLNPIIVSTIAIIIILSVCHIDFDIYEKGAGYISIFLTPATICYAVPLYRQVQSLKDNAPALVLGILSGCVTSALCVIGFSLVFNFSHELYLSMLPKSITTAIGIALSEQIGGLPAVTVGAIMVTGLTGAVIAPVICRLFRITEREAVGIAIGSASHAIGTSKAFEIGEVEGAMSSLSIVISGIITVVLVPFLRFI